MLNTSLIKESFAAVWPWLRTEVKVREVLDDPIVEKELELEAPAAAQKLAEDLASANRAAVEGRRLLEEQAPVFHQLTDESLAQVKEFLESVDNDEKILADGKNIPLQILTEPIHQRVLPKVMFLRNEHGYALTNRACEELSKDVTAAILDLVKREVERTGQWKITDRISVPATGS